jgi:hypothetical protein
MLTIYSLECFIYKSLNAGHRFGDKSKIDSLGPYAQVMDKIVNAAIMERKDEFDEDKFKNIDLFRGTSLSDAQIKQNEEYAGKNKYLSIYGHISTSTSREKAISFANSDVSLGKHAVLYEIKWTMGLSCC